jgi:hypothetical protein
MGWEDDYHARPSPGPYAERGNDAELQREVEEHAAHHAELDPGPPTPASLTSIARRVAARLRGAHGRRDAAQTAAPSEDVWAEEEALYRAKDEGEPHA